MKFGKCILTNEVCPFDWQVLFLPEKTRYKHDCQLSKVEYVFCCSWSSSFNGSIMPEPQKFFFQCSFYQLLQLLDFRWILKIVFHVWNIMGDDDSKSSPCKLVISAKKHRFWQKKRDVKLGVCTELCGHLSFSHRWISHGYSTNPP